MPLDEKERLAVVETKVEAMASDMHEIKADVKRIADVMAQTRGGWKVILAVGAISGSMGAALAKMAPFLPFGK